MSAQPPPVSPPSAPRHSPLGIAAFIVSASSIVLGVAAVVVLGMASGKYLLGPFCSCGFPTALVGVGLGIGGLAQKNCKKLFAYLGIALGALILIINGILIVTGNID
jgi:hypothetical protein